MGDVLLPSCKGNICTTENTKNHNAFLVIAEWKAHEIFKTWSGDFVLKHLNCQSRAVESLSEPRDEQQLGGKWRRKKKIKAQLFHQKTIARKRSREIEGFLAESCFVSCISFGAVKMWHVLYCMFLRKSQTNQPSWFQGSKASLSRVSTTQPPLELGTVSYSINHSLIDLWQAVRTPGYATTYSMENF